jgi:hypothetical protein
MTRVHRHRQEPQFDPRHEGDDRSPGADCVTSGVAATDGTTPAEPALPASQAPAVVKVAKPRYMDRPVAPTQESDAMDRAQETHQRA